MQSRPFHRYRGLVVVVACTLSVLAGRDAYAQAPAPAPGAVPQPPPPPPPVVAPAPAPPLPPAPPPLAPPPAEPGTVAPAPYPPAYVPTAPVQAEWGTPVPTGPAERPAIFFGYEMATPVGELHDFISKSSFRGFELGALWPVYRSLYVGSVFNYHLFYEELGRKTYQVESGALNANLYRYAKYWTIQAEARYLFFDADAVARPFVGLRLGIAFATTATLVSDLSLYDSPTGFALSPEAGVLLSVASIMHLSGSVRYDFTTVSSGALENGSYLAYHLGFLFHQR